MCVTSQLQQQRDSLAGLKCERILGENGDDQDRDSFPQVIREEEWREKPKAVAGVGFAVCLY